jgi:hypothetical protein
LEEEPRQYAQQLLTTLAAKVSDPEVVLKMVNEVRHNNSILHR